MLCLWTISAEQKIKLFHVDVENKKKKQANRTNVALWQNENTELSTGTFCPSTLCKWSQATACDGMQRFIQLLVGGEKKKKSSRHDGKDSGQSGRTGGELGGGREKPKRTPLRPLPLHPQYMNMSLLQTCLQSHQKQTREKPKKLKLLISSIHIHTE